MHFINHEWNRSMFVASAVCFVWDTKLDFSTIGIRARFSFHACITCDWVLEFKKTVIFVFSNFCIKLLLQEDTTVTFVFVPYGFGVCFHQGDHLHFLWTGLLKLFCKHDRPLRHGHSKKVVSYCPLTITTLKGSYWMSINITAMLRLIYEMYIDLHSLRIQVLSLHQVPCLSNCQGYSYWM